MCKFQPIIHKYVNLNQIPQFNFGYLYKLAMIFLLNMCKKRTRRDFAKKIVPRSLGARKKHMEKSLSLLGNRDNSACRQNNGSYREGDTRGLLVAV